MKTDTRLLIYIDKQRFNPGSYKVLYQGGAQKGFSSFSFPNVLFMLQSYFTCTILL